MVTPLAFRTASAIAAAVATVGGSQIPMTPRSVVAAWHLPIQLTASIGASDSLAGRVLFGRISVSVDFGTASFGRINDVANRANPARQIQLGAKLLW